MNKKSINFRSKIIGKASLIMMLTPAILFFGKGLSNSELNKLYAQQNINNTENSETRTTGAFATILTYFSRMSPFEKALAFSLFGIAVLCAVYIQNKHSQFNKALVEENQFKGIFETLRTKTGEDLDEMLAYIKQQIAISDKQNKTNKKALSPIKEAFYVLFKSHQNNNANEFNNSSKIALQLVKTGLSHLKNENMNDIVELMEEKFMDIKPKLTTENYSRLGAWTPSGAMLGIVLTGAAMWLGTPFKEALLNFVLLIGGAVYNTYHYSRLEDKYDALVEQCLMHTPAKFKNNIYKPYRNSQRGEKK
jgi:hypothetical protein